MCDKVPAPTDRKAEGEASPRPIAYVLKVAAYVVVAVAVMLAFLVVGSRVMEPKDNSPEAGMIEPAANGIMGEKAGSIDVLVLGDSVAYNSISPTQLYHEHGFTSYTCASPGQALAYANTLLHRALEGPHPQRPVLVLIEAAPLFTELSLGNALSRTAQDLFPLIEYHSRWKSLTLDDFTKQPQATWTDELKGFRVYRETKPADDEARETHMAPTGDTEAISRVNGAYLKRIVEYCRANGAEPVLISVPSIANWNMARHDSVSAWADEHGVGFVDFNTGSDKVEIDWTTQTKDGGNHLNYDGATAFTHALGQLLVQRYSLPDHRADPAYAAEWDAAYATCTRIATEDAQRYDEA